jgi:hypothetical protein
VNIKENLPVLPFLNNASICRRRLLLCNGVEETQVTVRRQVLNPRKDIHISMEIGVIHISKNKNYKNAAGSTLR